MAKRYVRPPEQSIGGLCLPILFSGMVLLSGCGNADVQSVLHPASPAAAEIAWLWWFMFITGSAVFVVVLILLLIALFRRRQTEQAAPPLGNTGFVVAGGIFFPSLILVVLLFFSLNATVALKMPESALTVQVVGYQWWWEIHYPEQDVTTANEIHIPVGRPVRLELLAADVIHSFWVPNLNGKMDLMPDHPNTFWIQADEPGVYRGQCAEYCGLQHAWMAFMVVALPPDEFDAWAASRQQPAPEPASPELQRGQQVFARAACDNCHAIRGTDASGRIGPDLSDIGSRRTLGAGTVSNTRGNLAGWIVNPQAIKPGNKMPPTYLEADDLNALLAYLESLK